MGNGATGVALPVGLARTLPATGVPAALFCLGVGLFFSFAWAGQHADRSNRAYTLVWSNAVRAVMNALLVCVFLWVSIFGIYVPLVASIGCLGTGLMAGFFRPARSAKGIVASIDAEPVAWLGVVIHSMGRRRGSMMRTFPGFELVAAS